MSRRRGTARLVAAILLVLSPLAVGAFAGDAGAAEYPAGPGTITIDQGPVGPTGFCLPPFLSLTHSVSQTPTTFVLTITASPSLCEPVSASAVIYAMPTGGGAWPQTLATKTPFVIRGPGVTTVTFTKGCLPAQYDVVTGDTPSTISPLGPWHGPLLFPFALETSLQFFGGTCGETGANCDDYTPTNVAVEPSNVAPGGTVTVSGSGTPGTTITISLRQPPAAAVPTGATVVVPASGQWSVPVTIPADTAPGSWQVVAGVEDCDTSTTADITVTGGESGSTTTTTSSVPPAVDGDGTGDPTAVAGESAERALPAAAVAGASVSSPGSNAQAAGLAFTGSNVRLPVVVGLGLLVAGVLLLLQRRRRS